MKDSAIQQKGMHEPDDPFETGELPPASVKADEYDFDEFPVTDSTNPVIGCWITPHNAGIKMLFYKSGRFEFHDYNHQSHKPEDLSGSYELKDETLTLFYSDRPKQRFGFLRDSSGMYYIKNNAGYYLVQGVCQ